MKISKRIIGYILIFTFLIFIFQLIAIYRHISCTEINIFKLAPYDVLYHGSTNIKITEFIPRAEHYRDKDEGELVFATPSLKLASCYLFEWDDSWVHQCISWEENESEYEVYMVIPDREKFKQLDSGGAIYFLPTKNFIYNENKGLGIYEWTNNEKVFPLHSIHFNSALEAMEKFKVKIYFVNKQQFKSYINLSGLDRKKFLENTSNI